MRLLLERKEMGMKGTPSADQLIFGRGFPAALQESETSSPGCANLSWNEDSTALLSAVRVNSEDQREKRESRICRENRGKESE